MKGRGWYIAKSEKTHGPFTSQELLHLVEIGKLGPGTYVWRPGFPDWQRAEDVDGLYKPPPPPSKSETHESRAEPRAVFAVDLPPSTISDGSATSKHDLAEEGVPAIAGESAGAATGTHQPRKDVPAPLSETGQDATLEAQSAFADSASALIGAWYQPTEEGNGVADAGRVPMIHPRPQRQAVVDLSLKINRLASLEPPEQASPGSTEANTAAALVPNAPRQLQTENRTQTKPTLSPASTRNNESAIGSPAVSTRGLLRSHWFGELSLTRSVLINTNLLLVLLLVTLVIVFFVPSEKVRLIRLTLIGSLVLYVPLCSWGSVGVWRSAQKHKLQTGAVLWPNLARASVILVPMLAAGAVLASLLPGAVTDLVASISDKLASPTVPRVSLVPGSAPLPKVTLRERRSPGTSEPLGARGPQEVPEKQTAGSAPAKAPSASLPGAPSEGQPSKELSAKVDIDQALIDQIWSKSKPSLVRIVAYGAKNIPRAVGMGFYFEKNLVATNLRLLKDAQSLVLESLHKQQLIRTVRLKAYSQEFDLAVLQVGQDSKPLPLSTRDAKGVGDKVIVFGHPTWSQAPHYTGSIRSLLNADDTRTYRVTASVSPGRSGGPVFDEQGNVMGIATFSLQGSQRVSRVMPISILEPLAEKEMSWQPKEAAKTQPVEDAIVFVNYSKEAQSKEEFVSFRNLTKDTVGNVVFAVAYLDKEGKLFYARTLKMKGPISSGLSKMQKYQTPKVAWPMAYTKIEGAPPEGSFRVEVVPLDYEVASAP